MTSYVTKIEDDFSRILGSSPHFSSGTWRIHIILNQFAGGFTKRQHRDRFLQLMSDKAASTGNSRRLPVHVHVTDYQGHASLIATKILESTRQASEKVFLISIGGDGTHQETLSGLMAGDPALFSRIRVFRFPAGTGNDGADAWTQDQAFTALAEGCAESYAGAIEFSSAGKESRYSFNIASLGIDAYIVHLTNRLKAALPGNFYKPLADIGVLFYRPIHGISTMGVKIHHEDGAQSYREDKYGIMVIGVSGWRTYGNEKWVLPGEENVCLIRIGNIFQNIKLRKHLFRATHGQLPSTTMASATRIDIHYPGTTVMQLDGEVTWLGPDDFPISFRIVDARIPILSSKQASKLRVSQSIAQHKS